MHKSENETLVPLLRRQFPALGTSAPPPALTGFTFGRSQTGYGAVWGSGQPRPTDPATRIRKFPSRKKKNRGNYRIQKIEVNFGYTFF